MDTSAVREYDSKGRHITVHRQYDAHSFEVRQNEHLRHQSERVWGKGTPVFCIAEQLCFLASLR